MGKLREFFVSKEEPLWKTFVRNLFLFVIVVSGVIQLLETSSIHVAAVLTLLLWWIYWTPFFQKRFVRVDSRRANIMIFLLSLIPIIGVIHVGLLIFGSNYFKWRNSMVTKLRDVFFYADEPPFTVQTALRNAFTAFMFAWIAFPVGFDYALTTILFSYIYLLTLFVYWLPIFQRRFMEHASSFGKTLLFILLVILPVIGAVILLIYLFLRFRDA